MKKQIAFLSVLMALVIAAITLGGLQLFSPYKPSNGFKKTENAFANTAMSTGVKRANIPYFTTESGDYTFTVTDNDTLHTTHSFSYAIQEKTPTTGSKLHRTVFTADLSDLIAQGYCNFQAVYGDRTSEVSNSTWTIDGLYSKSFFSNVTFTCETSWAMVPLPEAPVKEGYTFTGWYTDEACTVKYEGETVREDMTLYAGFTINRYTVTYDSNGGSSHSAVTVDWNTVPTLPTPERLGYNFVGWYNGDTQYEGAPIKADTTLTAHWEIMTFTVTFMSDGAVYKQITVEYGTSLREAMAQADIASYAAMTTEGVRLSKQNSIVTEDTQVLVQDLSGWEKYGDFVGNHTWYTWLTVGVIGVLAITTVIMAIVIKKRG